VNVQRGNLESLQSLLGEHPQGSEGSQHHSEGSAAENESVHRKMLALMALDLPGKQGTRCVWSVRVCM